MDPTAIFEAIKLADLAIDAAAKVKSHFFNSSTHHKSNSTDEVKTSVTLATVQTEVNLLKNQLDELTAEVTDNRKIIQEQNEIIVGLSNALKVTAETAQRLRRLMHLTLALSVASILGVLYVFIR